MRSGRITLSIIAGAIATAAFASPAQAQDFAADFSSDDEGFTVFQFVNNSKEDPSQFDPAYSSTGGNPGGYISYTDPDSGSPQEPSGAYFVSPFAGSANQIGGTVSFDLRSSASGTPHLGNFVAVQNSVSETIYCAFGFPTGWQTFSVEIDAGNPCWKDASDSTDATPTFMQDVVGDAGSIWFVSADLGTGAGEVTDLDNFIIDASEPGIARELTIRYKKRSRAFGGVLSQEEGPIGDACVQGVEVELYKVGGQTDTLLDTDLTDQNGKWKIAKKARRNKRYYALAPAMTEPDCAEAQSKSIKPL